MRYCSSCHRWFSARPTYCPACGRTWDVKLCPRGHENDANSNNNYCSTCGSPDLSQCSGKERWFSIMLGFLTGKAGMITIISFAILMLCSISKQGFELLMSFVLAIGVLIIGVWVAFSMMPSFLKSVLRWLWRRARESINSRGQNTRQ